MIPEWSAVKQICFPLNVWDFYFFSVLLPFLQGYCDKNECDKVKNIPVADGKSGTDYLLITGKWLSKLIGIARYMLPSSLRNIDDAGAVSLIKYK